MASVLLDSKPFQFVALPRLQGPSVLAIIPTLSGGVAYAGDWFGGPRCPSIRTAGQNCETARRSSNGRPPVYFPLRRDAAILSRVRSAIISRSNWAKEQHIEHQAAHRCRSVNPLVRQRRRLCTCRRVLGDGNLPIGIPRESARIKRSDLPVTRVYTLPVRNRGSACEFSESSCATTGSSSGITTSMRGRPAELGSVFLKRPT